MFGQRRKERLRRRTSLAGRRHDQGRIVRVQRKGRFLQQRPRRSEVEDGLAVAILVFDELDRAANDPRHRALSEFWLSATGTPWLVVSPWPVESTRTRSSGRLPGLKPCCGLPLPTFADAAVSLSVLPVTSRFAGAVCAPTGGCSARFPCSTALLALKGIAAARSLVAANFAAAAAAPFAAEVPCREPPAVDFADALAGDLFAGGAGAFDFPGISFLDSGRESACEPGAGCATEARLPC